MTRCCSVPRCSTSTPPPATTTATTGADLARLARASVTHSTMPAESAANVLADIDSWQRGL